MVNTLDNLICPYCLQQLTINRTYEKQNGTIVRFFVKYKSNYKHNENCIFKQKVISGFSKNEIQREFQISIPSYYTIVIENKIPIEFGYIQHKIEGIYECDREEFICRLKTNRGQTLFCMLCENEINIRNENDDIWDKYNATLIVFNKDEPCINSAIETKINIHSNFYTRCLYSKIQKEAYEIECRNKKAES